MTPEQLAWCLWTIDKRILDEGVKGALRGRPLYGGAPMAWYPHPAVRFWQAFLEALSAQ